MSSVSFDVPHKDSPESTGDFLRSSVWTGKINELRPIFDFRAPWRLPVPFATTDRRYRIRNGHARRCVRGRREFVDFSKTTRGGVRE